MVTNFFFGKESNTVVKETSTYRCCSTQEGYTENIATFDIIEKEMKKIHFSSNRLLNVDETGITVVQHKTSRVIALNVKKKVATQSSSERGASVTVVKCMSASGIFVPPLLAFLRKNTKLELLNGTPPPPAQLENATLQGGCNWKFSLSGSNISLKM
jgi:hypothetical protein